MTDNKDTNSTEKDELVSVPKGLLEGLQEQIEELKNKQIELEKSIPEDEKELDEVPDNLVRLRKWDDKIVIGYNKERGTFKTYDKERREDRLMQEIILLDKNEKETKKVVDYNIFMEEAPILEVQLLDIERETVTKKLGFIKVKEVLDYRTINTPNKVMQKVISSIDTAVVKMPDGEKLRLDIDFINM